MRFLSVKARDAVDQPWLSRANLKISANSIHAHGVLSMELSYLFVVRGLTIELYTMVTKKYTLLNFKLLLQLVALLLIFTGQWRGKDMTAVC